MSDTSNTSSSAKPPAPPATPGGAPAGAAPGAPKGAKRSRALLIAALVFIAAGLGYTAYYLLYAQFHEDTDDAYVNANLVYVNAQVSGTVTALAADDNQPVRTGDALVRLDHADAQIALEDAEGRLGEIVRQIRQDTRSVDAAQAIVAQRKTDLARAEADLGRRAQLGRGEALSAEDLAHAEDAVTAARDALKVAQEQLSQARAPIEGTTLIHQPSVLRARAAYVQAQLAAQRNDIVAPVDGFVARRSVQVGQHVQPGASLLAVVPLQSVWIDANFKEPQLRNIRIGQAATVSADMYGDHVEYHGRVASISAGSGGAFSLLPPQNATGNWIKVVQRVPVRIVLDPRDLEKHPLRVGLSTEVNIDTHQRDGRVDTALPVDAGALGTRIFDSQLAAAEAHADAVISREAGQAQ